MTTTDTRSVHTDALATLGTIIDAKQKRDAIHLAVIPARAAQTLAPGESVLLAGVDAVSDGRPSAGLGIVDPFLKEPVKAGQWFWLVIYPRVITSLRHVWSHPAIGDEVGASASTDNAAIVRAKARVAEIAAGMACAC